MRPTAALAVAAAVLALAGCGTSKEAQAKDQVCSARDDIAKQVDTLKGLTLSTSAPSKAKNSLNAIQKDVRQISAAQGDLNGQRKSQVQSANQAFAEKVKSTASDLGSAGSIGAAATQLTSAFQDLAAAYKQTLAKVDCSS